MYKPQALTRVGGIETFVVEPGDSSAMRRIISQSDAGIVLTSENALINTYRIDDAHNGCVLEEAVNPDSQTGNQEVLELIRLMQQKSGVSFFPGTMLQDFGNYAMPVMPVVANGKLDSRVKTTTSTYVDSYEQLALTFFGKDYAAKVKKHQGLFAQEPMKTLVNELEKRSKALKKFRSYDINGVRVLQSVI